MGRRYINRSDVKKAWVDFIVDITNGISLEDNIALNSSGNGKSTTND